ncbi:MAG: hypothetical protein IT306_22590 [Chloroflexi bacterium]|nr:hypothetical protein [Chloroflexota bacterium]
MSDADGSDGQALLYVHMNPAPGREDEFHRWYDDHAAKRSALPGVLSARRYWRVGEDGPRHLAWYDLETASVLQSPTYLALRERERDADQAFMSRLLLVDRRVYQQLDLGEPWTRPWTAHAPYLVSMTMDPPESMVEDYHQWYLQEHIPLLMRVPGWRRILRYQQLDGRGPSFLAVHELDSLDAFKTPEFTAAVSTPWRDKVISYVGRRERLTFEFLRAL